MPQPPPWIEWILQWLVPRKQRGDFVDDLAERYVSLPNYVKQAGIRIYEVHYSNVIHSLMTSWLFDVNRLGVFIVAGAFVAGMLELPVESTPLSRRVDNLCGVFTALSIVQWMFFPVQRTPFISALFSVVLLLQIFIAVLSAFPTLGAISVDEWSLTLMVLTFAIGVVRYWYERWKRSRIETVGEFVRALFIAFRRSFSSDPVRQRAMRVMTVCWLGGLMLPPPSPGGEAGGIAGFGILIRVVPLGVLVLMHRFYKRRSWHLNMQFVLFVLLATVWISAFLAFVSFIPLTVLPRVLEVIWTLAMGLTILHFYSTGWSNRLKARIRRLRRPRTVHAD